MTAGFAAAEYDHRVREEGGNNYGPRVRKYLANAVPSLPEGHAWCAAWVQYCADKAAETFGLDNPLNEVRVEVRVASYVEWAEETGRQTATPERGDLVCFKFSNSARWNHIGFVARPPDSTGMMWCLEGNTSDVNQRDGDGVYLKPRFLSRQPTYFIRW